MEALDYEQREATGALFQAVGALGAALARTPGANAAAVQIVAAVAELLRVQERRFDRFESERGATVRRRREMDIRVEALEEALVGRGREGGEGSSDVEFSERVAAPDVVCEHVDRVGDVGDGCVVSDRQRGKDRHVGQVAERESGERKRRRKERLELDVEEELLPDPIESQTPQSQKLPKLPTLKDVQREAQDRSKNARARERYRPPACARCCVRKRANMFREKGYINETVFERWASKPGNCIEYMHQDEDLDPIKDVRSELSFAESSTRSPPPTTKKSRRT